MKTYYVIGGKKGNHPHDESEKTSYSETAHRNDAEAVAEVKHENDTSCSCHFDHSLAMRVIKSPRWTATQLEDATLALSFPEGTTVWDKFVAYNSFYDDMRTVYTEEEILKGAYIYFFADKDAPDCKIWHYMKAMKKI